MSLNHSQDAAGNHTAARALIDPNSTDLLSLPKTSWLRDDNWLAWKTRIKLAFKVHGVFGLVMGSEPKPPELSAHALPLWERRDLVAQALIVLSITDPQILHVSGCANAADMWYNLVLVHEPPWMMSQVRTQKALYTRQAPDGVNVPEHVRAMRLLHIRLGCQGGSMGDDEFKRVLVASLPESWQGFMFGVDGRTVPELTSLLCEEYKRRQERAARDYRLSRGIKGKPMCGICNKVGHADKDCGRNPANRGKGRVSKGRRTEHDRVVLPTESDSESDSDSETFEV